MRRIHRTFLLVSLLALAPVLAGCADFDLDKLDVFGLNEKKKLPGERKDVFPEGVPGVSQGIPPEYLRQNQVAPEATAAQTAAVEPAQEEKPKPQAKPKPKPRTASRPTRVNMGAEPAQAGATQQQQEAAPAQPAAQSPWPSSSQSSPPAGTFSR